jgi:NitT/TauT family transport system ATP-binding protein
MIELRRVCKEFNSSTRTTVALREVSLQIARGELVCLVGPSGCGKTTLLNLIAGLEKPDSGEVLVGGRPVTGPGPDRVVMFQDAALFPWLTVAENVQFGLRELGLGRKERIARSQRYLAMVNMSSFQRAYVHELSGGMKQRVALARALALEPHILLMDEPFGALDSKSRDVLQQEIVDVWARTHKTVVFVTHDLAEAVRLGSRVILLRARPARVARDVAVGALIAHPRHTEQPEVLELATQLKRDLDDTGKHELASDEESAPQQSMAEDGEDEPERAAEEASLLHRAVGLAHRLGLHL